MKLTKLFTSFILFITLTYGEYYSDQSVMRKSVNSCSSKTDITAETLSNELYEKYEVTSFSEDFLGAKITNFRQGLADKFLDLLKINGVLVENFFPNQNYLLCRSITCLADEVFGNGLGVFYISILDEYNLNLSHIHNEYNSRTNEFLFKNSKPYLKDELVSITRALKVFPKNVLKHLEYSSPAKRIDRDENGTIADASISFYNIWSNRNDILKIKTIVHELGHKFSALLSDESVDQSVLWTKLSGWDWDRSSIVGAFSATRNKEYNNFVSKYSMQNPLEDFAESFTSYILNPHYLKEIAPEKFLFLKEYVFAGIDYTLKGCHSKEHSLSLKEKILYYPNYMVEESASICRDKFNSSDHLSNTFLKCLGKYLLYPDGHSVLADEYNYDLLGKRHDTRILPIVYSPQILLKLFDQSIFKMEVVQTIQKLESDEFFGVEDNPWNSSLFETQFRF